MYLRSALSCRPSAVNVLVDGGNKPLTNDQICDFIAAKVARFRQSKDFVLFKQPDPRLQPESSTSTNTTAVLLGAVTAGPSPLDSWRNAKSSSESEKKEDVAAACVQEERSHVFTATGSVASCDELMEESALTVVCGSSQPDGAPLDGDQTLGDKAGETEQETGGAVREGRDVAISASGTTKEKASKDQQGSMEHCGTASSVFQQVKHNQPAHSSADGLPRVPILTDPQYDDISDVEELSGKTTRVLRLEKYDDISEDENLDSKTPDAGQNIDLPKTPTVDEVPDRRSPCLAEGAGHSEHEPYGEGGLGAQPDPCCVEGSDQSEQDSEDEEWEWDLIPVIPVFGPEPVEQQPVSGNAVQGQHDQVHQGGKDERPNCALKPVPVSAFSKMAVFDTPDHQEQAIKSGQLSFVVLSCGAGAERNPEREDSDTDDSATYSSGSECNYMTVPKELFNRLPPARRKADHRVDVQMPVLEKFQSRLSPDDEIINLLDSDEDDDIPGATRQTGSPEESEECVLVEDPVSKDEDSVVIILSDSEDEGRENYNIRTADSVDCCGAGPSGRDRNTATPELDKSDQSREGMHSETDDDDDFPHSGGNVLPPQRKKRKSARLSSDEEDSTVSSSVIPRLLVQESESNQPVTLVREPRGHMPRGSSSIQEWLEHFIRERVAKPVSVPNRPNDSNQGSSRCQMQGSSSHSSGRPAASEQTSSTSRFPPLYTSLEPAQATSHARDKVYNDWKDKHVPLRREKKKKTGGGVRRR